MSDQLAPIATFHAYDQDELDRLAHSSGYMAILGNVEEYLRSDQKYKELPHEVYQYVEKLRGAIYDWRSMYHLPE